MKSGRGDGGPAAASEGDVPGRLVLVVGPSGAGKDTLIDLVREGCAGDAGVVFPRRIVTREASVHEGNLAVSTPEFMVARARGDFALDWDAHGLSYGLPWSIVDDVARGRIVVVNVSRSVIAAARERFRRVIVVLVTAPPAILAARLAGRGRISDGELAGRLKRSEGFVDVGPDAIIHNVGAAADHARELLAVVRGGAN